MSTLRDIGESGFIDRIVALLSASPEVIEGPGDDCAVLRVGDRTLLVTCDLSMENVHFRRGAAAPEDLGWKAAAAGLSDIAAMGGVPQFLLTSVAAPAETDADELEGICRGVVDVAQHCGAVVVGGDVTRSTGGIVLDVMVIGEAPEGRFRLRSGAKPGDMLAVTGWPGRSAAGFEAEERGIDAPTLVRAHYRPEPRIREGRWLCARDDVHAMIDVSDGVVQDAGHLAERSGLGVAMTSASVAADPELAALCAETGRSIQDYVFTGGEAYELAFAIDPATCGKALAAFREEFGLPVVILGEFSDAFNGVLIDGEAPTERGYEHF
ncbi:MAG: thiamine-phosphate kinase [Candidatus Hydrogenedentes bacterium]|nr:thiamine-phosphate kinase [Candidatus Hydrogenedentota bacterium]